MAVLERLASPHRGPRLGTKIMLLGLMLLVVPYFSYRQLVEMERLLVRGQSHAQLLTAEGISTLFNGRDDLFNDLPVSSQDYESLYAHPLQSTIRLDGSNDDWGPELEPKFRQFGSESGTSDADFKLLIGERSNQLHLYMTIVDNVLVPRDPEYLRLDQADHVRLSFIRADGEDARLTMTLPAPGVTTTYPMDQQWRRAANGVPDNRVQGFMQPTDNGLVIEFRLPLSMVGSRRFFGLTYVDVDDPISREQVQITQTLPTAGKESFNLVVLRSPEVLNIIRGLGYSGARILVIDAQQRVRAETGAHQSGIPSVAETHWYSWITDLFAQARPFLHYVTTGTEYDKPLLTPEDSQRLASTAIEQSLAGNPMTLQRRLADEQELIVAAHPIVTENDEIIGTVVVEQNINEILSFQRETLEQVILLSVFSLFAVFIALLAFAGRLAWRIRKLRREASAAIDDYGRLRRSELTREMSAGDEIGELARSVSNMLSKLHQHNNFLENMPRTLRHEINNPLNTLSTSLDNLAEENPDVQSSKYLASAKRGVNRIGSIVQNLADAANLEESLQAEEREIIDIQQLLKSYVANCSISHNSAQFVYRGTSYPVHANVSDFRIEQLLDKIVDNAIDFHRTNSPIKVQLDTYRDYLQITVANRGPVLPKKAENSLFDSMVSHRGPQNRLHFGLGLYVVRIIAEYHGGFVRAMNLTDGSGVAIMVQLPLARAESDTSRSNHQSDGSSEPAIRAQRG